MFWDPFTEGGGPFFANGVVGLLYPPNVLFHAFEPNLAVHLVLILSMLAGGIGMLLLAQQWGLGWPVALGGALAFQLGDPMAQFVAWNPTITAPLVWVPWAFLICERLLRRPTGLGVVGLAGVLALQLLPGNVLVNALTYQLIAFRVAWEFIWRRGERPWRAVGAVAAGMVLAPLLVAVQLLPYLEWVGESMRITVPVGERLRLTSLPFEQHVSMAARRLPSVPFLVVPFVLAGIAPLASATRRLAVFWLAMAVVYSVLALGHLTPAFALYVKLPPGGTVLHIAHRLFWVTGISLSVLSAFGLHALASGPDRGPVRAGLPLIALSFAAALYAFAPGGLRRVEMAALALVLLAVLIASARPARRPHAVWIAVAALVLNLTTISIRWGGYLLPDLAACRTHAPALERIANESMTVQDRLLLMPTLKSALSCRLMHRTSSMLGLRNFSDYEVLPGQRYVGYVTMMLAGTPARTYTDQLKSIFSFAPDVRPRLLDVAAIRYVVMPAGSPSVDLHAAFPRVPVADAGLRVYRNDASLPRARFVPRIEVIPEPEALLARLAKGDDRLASVAFVEEPPPSGFTGTAGAPEAGNAQFVVDDPEHILIDVEAPRRGFLVLADTYYPGWRATVNGAPATILRANYMFRLVEVPAGASRVEFTFLPTHLMLGAAVSGVTLAGLGLILIRAVRARAPASG